MDYRNESCYLSTAYWGPVQYFTKLRLYKNIFIEQYETYPKQTYRNRCLVYGPNGVQSLQVPVESGSFHKIITRDLKIAYYMPWQKNHLQTIITIYRSAPFYEYIIDDILPLYNQRSTFLIDFNNHITQICTKWLKLENNIRLTDQFNIAVDGFDYRFAIHPKEQKNNIDPQFVPIQYHQVFNDRSGFMPNLSILDLLMNCGPEAIEIIEMSIAGKL
jgi:hypothetical protein